MKIIIKTLVLRSWVKKIILVFKLYWVRSLIKIDMWCRLFNDKRLTNKFIRIILRCFIISIKSINVFR